MYKQTNASLFNTHMGFGIARDAITYGDKKMEWESWWIGLEWKGVGWFEMAREEIRKDMERIGFHIAGPVLKLLPIGYKV